MTGTDAILVLLVQHRLIGSPICAGCAPAPLYRFGDRPDAGRARGVGNGAVVRYGGYHMPVRFDESGEKALKVDFGVEHMLLEPVR